MGFGKLLFIWLPTIFVASAMNAANDDGTSIIVSSGSFYATKLDGRHCHISGLGFDWHFHVYYHLVYTDTLKCIDDKSQRHDFAFNSLHELEGATTDNRAADSAINSGQVDLLSQASVYALAIASADRCWAAAQEVFKFVSGSLDAGLTDDNVGHFMFLLCAKYRQAILGM
ncbi:hypothetical protein FOZ61_006512 [Perkinsus olseni]|uniref:Uncharacterized protein n=1 Tax=Perkinsus olseni TaxID=32597 RepID=A0A7J6LPD5_PEROL|nr:hypothetical protein FOZ61_006512 [Perkinsus olseni]KAF4661155.1 hypothetical protein FOL46_005849 [Perkinsus olseni]